MKCPKCGRPNRLEMIQCSRCFTMLRALEQPQTGNPNVNVHVHKNSGCATVALWIIGIAIGLFLLILLVGLLHGCAEIHENTRTVDWPIRTSESRKVTSGWRYEAKVKAYDNRDGAFDVCVKLFQFKDCTITTHKIVERTEFIERTGPSQTRWYVLSAATALSGGILAAGVLTLDQLQAQRGEYLATAGLAIGAALGLLVYGIVNDVRASDSTNYLGQVSEDTPRKAACGRGPIAGVEVELRASGGRLLGGTTDGKGFLQARVGAEAVFSLGPDYRILIAGREIAQTKALADIYAGVLKEREEERRQTALAEQERELGKRRQEETRRWEWEQAEEIRLRGEADRIRRAKNAVKIWDYSLLHRPDRLNSKVFLSLSFENLTYRNVIGVTTRVRILNPFGKSALSRTFENSVKLPAREGIAESVRVEDNTAWTFEELAFASPDYRRLWKIAEDGTAKITIRVSKVIFEDRSILK